LEELDEEKASMEKTLEDSQARLKEEQMRQLETKR
jgi:hypothetical protein